MDLNIYEEKIINLEKYNDFINELLKLMDSYSNYFLLLSGNLGSGKTTFTKFFAKYIGIKDNISSPTFNILNRYKINESIWLNHFDFFRLKNNEDLNFFDDLTHNSLNIIEWPEINTNFWIKKKKKIFLSFYFYNNSEQLRKIIISNNSNSKDNKKIIN